jgi:hypothetical protein
MATMTTRIVMFDLPAPMRGLFDEDPAEAKFLRQANEATRRDLLPAEATVRTIAWTYLFGAVVGGVSFACVLGSERLQSEMVNRANAQHLSPDALKKTFVVFSVLPVVYGLLMAWGLLRRSNVIRWISVVASCVAAVAAMITLLGPLGTDLSALEAVFSVANVAFTLIYAGFLSSKSFSPIFTAEYKNTIEETPELKPSLGARDLGLLGSYLVVVVLVLGILVWKMTQGA